MGGCTSSPAKDDARPKQSVMPASSSAKPAGKTSPNPTTQPPASANATDHAQTAHTPGGPVAASPGLNGTGESTPNGEGTDDLAAFLNEGPVSPTQSDMVAGAQSKGPKDRSYAIDKQIEEDSRKFKKECKILLLGSGESGKSTIVKQMKIIHQNGYSKDELLQFKYVIYKNLIDSAQALILACRKIGVDPEDPTNRVNADAILEYRIDADPNHTLSQQVALAIESLWHDPIIPSVMDRSSEFYLMDSATYFFQHVRRIAAPEYVPMEADVLRARTKTTGITETRFNMGQLSIHMFDVGGQRSERKKWIHCFEAVTSIIFCVALSEYDQVLLEESGQNRMQESLILFESVINSRWFLRSSVILFLNKIDVFKMKLSKTPLDRYFPEYTGGADINKAAKYILWRFTQTNRARLSIYPHLTQATDTSNVRQIMQDQAHVHI
ncbi:guanine nucleotide-binding protein subunit alpha [Naganishia friedmannii]|uniref:Guanine nucleotide-binding protein subunit alpha n=1 Tax=Naganishia friedmannii TaxID=89922 RepID=A0ACC2VAB1_9TREE|nr:guanine nucleotide-binding protein subunit alpha [Naganishia friedmannii]